MKIKKHRLLIMGFYTGLSTLAVLGMSGPVYAAEKNSVHISTSEMTPSSIKNQKNYLIPAGEILIFQFLLNRFDYYFIKPRDHFDVDSHSIKNHIQDANWRIDQDDFRINQLGHPYQGAIYFGFARSSGLNYWESLLYSNAGSVVWEIAGETTDPSINDQVASGTGGSFIGEALYRLAELVRIGDGSKSGFWRQFAAGAISPASELNRHLFGEQKRTFSHNYYPALSSELKLGMLWNVNRQIKGTTTNFSSHPGYVSYHLGYGLPGRFGYKYTKPFDYFDIEINSHINNTKPFTSANIRGILFGREYQAGDDYRGLWGLYGNFDYLAPQAYRLSTTGASLGTTGQWWATEKLAIQSTALMGLGFGAVGTISPSTKQNNYHYGLTPQQLLSLRFIYGKHLMLDATGRNYRIHGVGQDQIRGHESVQDINTSLTVRLYKEHSISFGYLLSRRKSDVNNNFSGADQLIRTYHLTYTLLGDPHFGAVYWGDHEGT